MKEFHNPYNFVTPIRTENISSENAMGRCPPPPHDRYVGYSGQIHCTVNTVTPLFISDSEGIQSANGHNTYRFFRVPTEDGTERIAIPSTSLRGMLRSVFETVTNSCFSVFDDRTMFWRMIPPNALELSPARIEQDKTSQKWFVRLFKGHRGRGDVQSAAWVYMKTPDDVSPRYPKASPYAQRRRPHGVEKFKDGDRCWARLRVVQHPASGHMRAFHFWDVIELSAKRSGIIDTDSDSEDIVAEGYFYRKGSIVGASTKGIKKKNERFFFEYYDESRNTVDLADLMEIDDIVVDNFRLLLEERDDKPHRIDERLVWVKIEEGKVKFISPVSISKAPYPDTTGDLLDFERKYGLYHCSDYSRLCPACRVFGWVSEQSESQSSKIAYAGRVRISHALLTQGKHLKPMTLAILSSPKPSTTFFYLLNNSGKPVEKLGYDHSKAQLRGRKHYLHHGTINRGLVESNDNSDQNRTIQDPVAEGSKFSFTISFESLSGEELGALLWSIELEDGMYHRLGYAKPFGFGSVKIQIVRDPAKTFLIDFRKRYETQDGELPDAWKIGLDNDRIDSLIGRYKESMETVYGPNWNRLLNELKAILVGRDNAPIHYPLCEKATTLSKSYNWFMKARKAETQYLLPLSTDKRPLRRIKCENDSEQQRGTSTYRDRRRAGRTSSRGSARGQKKGATTSRKGHRGHKWTQS